ncbi:hypothetical protein [Sphingobacterium siyangense]|uniref:hypothetical protein n=1 Tax=Sphingobacterium siyangense TaxID=459529 RepID=UPI0011A43D29|nr:hypothetical protein [Sphingobacterium siyangense]
MIIIHLTSHSASAEYLSFLRKEEIPYLITGKERVSLKETPFLSVCLRRNKHSGLVQVVRFSPSAYITQQAEILLDQLRRTAQLTDLLH